MENEGIWRKDVVEEHSIQQGERKATIFFRNNQFQRCEFETVNHPYEYSYDDWMFLKMIAEKISEIIQEKLKSKVEKNP